MALILGLCSCGMSQLINNNGALQYLVLNGEHWVHVERTGGGSSKTAALSVEKLRKNEIHATWQIRAQRTLSLNALPSGSCGLSELSKRFELSFR